MTGLRAYRVTGSCLEPAIRDGSIVIIDPDLEPHDGDVVVARVTRRGARELLVRVLRRDPAISETFLLATDQAQHEPVIAGPCDMDIEGPVVSVVTPASGIAWDQMTFPVRLPGVPLAGPLQSWGPEGAWSNPARPGTLPEGVAR